MIHCLPSHTTTYNKKLNIKTHLLLYQSLQTVREGSTFRDGLDENGIVACVQRLQQRVEQGKQQHATVNLLDHNLQCAEENQGELKSQTGTNDN